MDLDAKGSVQIQRLVLKPLHRMRKLEGHLEELLSTSVSEVLDCEDYFQITLKDEAELIDPIGKKHRKKK